MGLLRIVAHTEARHLHLVSLELLREDALLFHHVLEQSRALFPVGVKANAHNTDIRCEGFAPRDTR